MQTSPHLAATHRLQPRTPSPTGGKDRPSFRRRGSLWSLSQPVAGVAPISQGKVPGETRAIVLWGGHCIPHVTYSWVPCQLGKVFITLELSRPSQRHKGEEKYRKTTLSGGFFFSLGFRRNNFRVFFCLLSFPMSKYTKHNHWSKPSYVQYIFILLN